MSRVNEKRSIEDDVSRNTGGFASASHAPRKRWSAARGKGERVGGSGKTPQWTTPESPAAASIDYGAEEAGVR
jgi:hypothetical protein